MVFFVMSGFLVSKSAMRAINENNLGMYFVNRFVRLYVVLIPALILTFFMDTVLINQLKGYVEVSLIQMIENRTSTISFFGNMFFLQDILVPRFGSNGPLWSLANEFWYYVLYPLIVLVIFRPLKYWKKLYVTSLVIGLLLILPISITKLFVLWLIGASIWYIQKPIIKNPIVSLTVFLIILTLSYMDFFQRSPFGFISQVGTATSFALVINSLIFYEKNHVNSYYKKINHIFADFSYSLYILHFPLLLVLNALIIKHVGIENMEIDSFIGFSIFIFLLLSIYLYPFFIYLLTEKHTSKLQHFFCYIFNKK
ncbi:MAG: peptidoglycan/LPS O-acetylase OafA/YrhL [Psychroserpens sp.]|jgi:peptidoglycan/LPS O-acetylase OafA/YrhL